MSEEEILPEAASRPDEKGTGAEQAGRSGEQSVDKPSDVDSDEIWSPGNDVASNKPVEIEDEDEEKTEAQWHGTSNTQAGM